MITTIKRIACATLAGIMLFVATGCTSQDNRGLSAEEPTTISIWHYYTGILKTAFDKMVSEFNETEGQRQGIIIEAFSQSSINDLAKKISSSANKTAGAENMPNLFATYVDSAVEIDRMGILASLNQYFTDEELGSYVKSYIDEGRIGQNNELKVFPIAKSTELMMINKTAFDKFAKATGAKIDDLNTWEGIAKVSEKYYNYSNGKAFFGRDSYANYLIIGAKQLNEEIFMSDGTNVTFNLNKTAMHRIWENSYIPFVNGYYTKFGRFATDDAKTGDIIALVGSSSGASYFPTSVVDNEGTPKPIDCMVLPVPNFDKAPSYAVQQGAGMAVTKSDQAHEYACALFLKWFTEKERNIEFALSSGYLPVKTEANDNTLIESIVKEKKIEISDVVKQTIKVAGEQIKDYTLYTSKEFRDGYDARQLLETLLLDRAKADRAKVVKEIKSGVSHKKAVAKVATEESFNSWYNDLKKQIENTIAK